MAREGERKGEHAAHLGTGKLGVEPEKEHVAQSGGNAAQQPLAVPCDGGGEEPVPRCCGRGDVASAYGRGGKWRGSSRSRDDDADVDSADWLGSYSIGAMELGASSVMARSGATEADNVKGSAAGCKKSGKGHGAVGGKGRGVVGGRGRGDVGGRELDGASAMARGATLSLGHGATSGLGRGESPVAWRLGQPWRGAVDVLGATPWLASRLPVAARVDNVRSSGAGAAWHIGSGRPAVWLRVEAKASVEAHDVFVQMPQRLLDCIELAKKNVIT